MSDPTTKVAAAPKPPSPRGPRARQRPRTHNNLPLPLTSFVGRADATSDVLRLLAANRLLTLTGPGGVGKTRLALEAARCVLEQFEHGVWWVQLEALCEAGLVVHEVARVLGLPDDPHRSREASIGAHLADRELLLILDNCEHLVAECASLSERLLSTCPRLRILATSREPLGVAGETAWTVPPLSLPDVDGPSARASLGQSEAGQLFLERALAIQPELHLTEETARVIAQVCCRLDGIPLAIELAAARVRVLSVAQIAARLDDTFRLLSAGSRTALPRHQTLKAAIEWSYDLLSQPEQKLFERLSVFSGGFTLEAAEAIAGDAGGLEAIQPGDVLDLLSHLVTKSLVKMREDGQVRYRMLDTIQQYALERLGLSGALEATRRRHLDYHLELARVAEAELLSTEQVQWLRVIETEHDNLRSALAWAELGGAAGAGLRLATTLATFWLRSGHLSEGSHWLERALAACREVAPVRIQALYQAGRFANQRGDHEQAMALARQSLALSRRLGDRRGMARALGLLGWVAHGQGDRVQAGPWLEESLVLARESRDERTIARTLLFLGDLRLRQGAHQEAAALLQESLGIYQRQGDGWSMAWAFGALGDVARLQGDYDRAVAHLQLSLSLYQDLGSRSEIPYPLEALALAAADQGQHRRAAQLMGAAGALRDSIHSILPPSYEADYAAYLHKMRAALGKDAFAAAWAEGRAMTPEQALSFAAATPPPEPAAAQEVVSRPAHSRRQARQYDLTPREVEVLRLLASGLSDAQIADRLVISPRTVGKHLQAIYSKLDLPSRSAATRWAIEHHLA